MITGWDFLDIEPLVARAELRRRHQCWCDR